VAVVEPVGVGNRWDCRFNQVPESQQNSGHRRKYRSGRILSRREIVCDTDIKPSVGRRIWNLIHNHTLRCTDQFVARRTDHAFSVADKPRTSVKVFQVIVHLPAEGLTAGLSAMATVSRRSKIEAAFDPRSRPLNRSDPSQTRPRRVTLTGVRIRFISEFQTPQSHTFVRSPPMYCLPRHQQ
jgi:hypothetical protein